MTRYTALLPFILSTTNVVLAETEFGEISASGQRSLMGSYIMPFAAILVGLLAVYFGVFFMGDTPCVPTVEGMKGQPSSQCIEKDPEKCGPIGWMIASPYKKFMSIFTVIPDCKPNSGGSGEGGSGAEEGEQLAKEEGEQLARAEADRLAKAEADRLAKEEADRQAKDTISEAEQDEEEE